MRILPLIAADHRASASYFRHLLAEADPAAVETAWQYAKSEELAPAALLEAHRAGAGFLGEAAFAGKNPMALYGFAMTVIAAALTAFYAWRLVYKTFHGRPHDHRHYEAAHESPMVMLVPLSVLAMGCFVAATQNWLITRNRWYENILLLLICFSLFRPDFWLDRIAPPFVKRPASDLVTVAGAVPQGETIRFRVTIDGKAPGADHGADTDADGQGAVDGQRLYQLVRQNGEIADRTFEIEFLDPGVQAYAFTFG